MYHLIYKLNVITDAEVILYSKIYQFNSAKLKWWLMFLVWLSHKCAFLRGIWSLGIS